MAKERVRKYRWYIEPLGNVAHANEVIARWLHEETDAESACNEKVCEDGKKHNLWDCHSRNAAEKIWQSRDSLHITIEIWSKEGGGKIRKITHLFRHRPRKPKGIA